MVLEDFSIGFMDIFISVVDLCFSFFPRNKNSFKMISARLFSSLLVFVALVHLQGKAVPYLIFQMW